MFLHECVSTQGSLGFIYRSSKQVQKVSLALYSRLNLLRLTVLYATDLLRWDHFSLWRSCKINPVLADQFFFFLCLNKLWNNLLLFFINLGSSEKSNPLPSHVIPFSHGNSDGKIFHNQFYVFSHVDVPREFNGVKQQLAVFMSNFVLFLYHPQHRRVFPLFTVDTVHSPLS